MKTVITLTVCCETASGHREVFDRFTHLTSEIGHVYKNVSLTSDVIVENVEPVVEEFHDDNTMHIVHSVLATRMTDGAAQEMVNSLQNHGILFRERRSDYSSPR